MNKLDIFHGVDRNLMVYDSDAPSGVFTHRLIALLKTVARRNGKAIITKIYLPTVVHIILEDFDEEIEDIKIIYNVDCVADLRLNKGEEFYNYFFNDLKGTLPKDDKYFAVAIAENGADESYICPAHVLLGSF